MRAYLTATCLRYYFTAICLSFFVVSKNNEWILKEIFAKFFEYEPKNIGYGDVYRIIQ